MASKRMGTPEVPLSAKVTNSLARMKERSPDARAAVSFEEPQVVLDVINRAYLIRGYPSRSEYARDVVCRQAFADCGLEYPRNLRQWAQDAIHTAMLTVDMTPDEKIVASKLLSRINAGLAKSLEGRPADPADSVAPNATRNWKK